MADKETDKYKDVSVVRLGSIVDDHMIHNYTLVAGPDRQIAEEAAMEVAIADEPDSWSIQEIDGGGKPKGGKSFYFSGATWKAPWQPTGHKPNWREPQPQTPEKPEPVN